MNDERTGKCLRQVEHKYIYIYYLELPLYNGGAYHQGRSSGASILYKTIMYNKFIAYSL